MIQVLDENRKRTAGENFAQAFSGLLNQGAQFMQGQREKEALRGVLGEEGADLPRDFQKMAYESKLKQQQQSQKLQGESQQEEQTYGIISDTFGKKFADVWKSSPVGARTELLKSGLDAMSRGQDVKNLFGGETQQATSQPKFQEEDFEEKSTPIKVIDYDKGLTPKERVSRQDKRYAQNLPLFQESQKKLQSYQMQGEEIDILSDLSPQIGTIERLNINPSTGDLIFPGLASPEAQQFVKTVNDFTTRAKDSYGSRVTNFDLNQFMRRLPTLANSEEGRKRILEQMKIINDLNMAYENSLHDVIDEHGGIRNIDYDQAEILCDH